MGSTVTASRIYSLCKEGYSLPKIAHRTHATIPVIRQAIIDDQPDWLISITEVLTPDDLEDLQDARCSLDIIADLFDIPEWQIRVYIIALPELFEDCTYTPRDRHTTPVDFLERIPGSSEVIERMGSGEERQSCTRCTIIEEPANPLEDGVCLWCRVELAGWSILAWHEEGCPELGGG